MENLRQDLYVKLFIAVQGANQVYLIADNWESGLFDLENKFFVKRQYLYTETICAISRSVCAPVPQERHSN